MWGKYSLAGTPPRLVGIPHRWHDPGPEEPIFNATSGQFDSWSSGDELDYFCSRTTTPGVKLRRTSSSIFFISRSFGSLKLIRYDSETMNPLWKRVLVPRVEPFGCAHTAGTRFSTMLTADPDTDDVWVVFTPLTPDALRSFVLWNSTMRSFLFPFVAASHSARHLQILHYQMKLIPPNMCRFSWDSIGIITNYTGK